LNIQTGIYAGKYQEVGHESFQSRQFVYGLPQNELTKKIRSGRMSYFQNSEVSQQDLHQLPQKLLFAIKSMMAAGS
jgi:hypothetical protein